MSASTIIGLGAVDAYDLLIEIAEQLAVFQDRPLISTNNHGEPVYGTFDDVTRTLPDASTSIYTPCYLDNLKRNQGQGEQYSVDGLLVVDRFRLYIAYAPDVGIDWRVRQIVHAATAEVLEADPLYVTNVEHIAPVLSIIWLAEVR